MKKKTKNTEDSLKRIFNYLIETGSLMFMKRTHQRSLLNTFDTVASHSYHVGIIAYIICRMEGLTHEDGIKAISLGVLHDTPEARTGDLDFIAKHYGQNDEHKAINDQLNGLPFQKDLQSLFNEYLERESHIAKCTKDADIVNQIYQEWILVHQGNLLAKRWFDGAEKNRIPYLRTESAKKLALLFKSSHPHNWWSDSMEKNGLNKELLNGKK